MQIFPRFLQGESVTSSQKDAAGYRERGSVDLRAGYSLQDNSDEIGSSRNSQHSLQKVGRYFFPRIRKWSDLCPNFIPSNFKKNGLSI